MQLLRDNLTLWTSDTQVGDEDANEAEQNWWSSPLTLHLYDSTRTPVTANPRLPLAVIAG